MFFIVISVVLLATSACGDSSIQGNSGVSTESSIIAESFAESCVATATSMLSEESTVDLEIINEYLTPLEEYSWERTNDVEFIMLHFCSDVVANPQNPYELTNVRQIFVDYEVSVHYIIDRDGIVYCYMPENRVAWHAGRGTWNNKEKYTNDMNRYSIGIEMLAIGSQSDMAQYMTEEQYLQLDESLIGYTEEQYASLDKMLDKICENNDISRDREHIIGHEEYSPLKSDPGELFDWNRIMEEGVEG